MHYGLSKRDVLLHSVYCCVPIYDVIVITIIREVYLIVKLMYKEQDWRWPERKLRWRYKVC